MPDTRFTSAVLHLLLCNLVLSQLTVNINYGLCCKKRGLVVSGNAHTIANSKITASTYWGAGHESFQARISNTQSGGAWVSKENDPNPWIQFDLGKTWTILAVVTRGRKDTNYNQFTMSYNVKYAIIVGNWYNAFYRPSEEFETTDPTMFPGNLDRDTLKVNFFDQPITARYLRIYPMTANQIHKSLRADFIGCTEK